MRRRGGWRLGRISGRWPRTGVGALYSAGAGFDVHPSDPPEAPHGPPRWRRGVCLCVGRILDCRRRRVARFGTAGLDDAAWQWGGASGA